MLGAGGDTMTPKWTRPSMWTRSHPFIISSFQFQPRAGDLGEWEKRGLHFHLCAPAPVGSMDHLTEFAVQQNISEAFPVIHICLYFGYIYSGETFIWRLVT